MKKHFSSIWFRIVSGYFVINLVTFGIIACILEVLVKLNLWRDLFTNPGLSLLLLLALVSILLGTLLSIVIFRYALKPITRLIKAMQKVAEGDYSVRLSVPGPEHSEFSLLERNFNFMAQELAGTEMLHTDFISNVSHEFKTPLSNISGYAMLLQDDTLSPEERDDYINIIVQNAKDLSHMTGSILELSRLENQHIVTGQEFYRVDEQIRQCILRMEPQWSAKDLVIEPELDSITWYGNQELTNHIWNNLLDNAIKFTPQGGEIIIKAFEKDQHLVVSIQDSGMGMSEEVQKHVFDKFYQGDTSHKKKGSGLGLALVHKIVTLYQGSITLESIPNLGTTFTVMLPMKLPVSS